MGRMSDEERGEQVFMKLSPDDRHDLKRYITGQIQNVLANEYGVGGKQNSINSIENSLVRALQTDGYADRVASRLLKRDSYSAPSVIDKALREAAQKAIADVVGDAAKNITFTFSIGQPKPADLNNDNYGTF